MIARILAAMVVIAPTSAGADDMFFGTWKGEVVDPGSDAPYPMTISIFEKNGRIFQHTKYGAPLHCAGGGVLIERTSGALHLTETILIKRDICADGTLRVYLNGDDTLIWEWFYLNGDFAARSDLERSE